MQKESVRSIFIKSVAAGMLIGVGGIVYLSVDNKYVGAFLFSLGLFTIIQFGFSLFTGKVGYIVENKPQYIINVLITLAGNMCGTAITSLMVIPTHIYDNIHSAALAAVNSKMGDNLPGRMILAFFCGMLMYIAVENAKQCKPKGNDMSLVFGTVMPVMVFIMCGFDHSIADCFYVVSAGISLRGILYLAVVALGNSVGGMAIPFMKKFFDGEKS